MIKTLTYKELIITAGSWCPNCKEDGASFHYKSYYDNNLFRPAIYICENCCKNWTEEEYNKLILIDQRKQKLEKINEWK
jgi:protein-arginine kinase activator protein McsA